MQWMACFTASLPTNANPNIQIMYDSGSADRGQLLYVYFMGGGRGNPRIMYGYSRMTVEPRIISMPGRSTSGFHRSGRLCLHQARSAVERGGETIARCETTHAVCRGERGEGGGDGSVGGKVSIKTRKQIEGGRGGGREEWEGGGGGTFGWEWKHKQKFLTKQTRTHQGKSTKLNHAWHSKPCTVKRQQPTVPPSISSKFDYSYP